MTTMSCALNLLLMVEDAKYKDFADRLNKSLQEKSIGVKRIVRVQWCLIRDGAALYSWHSKA